MRGLIHASFTTIKERQFSLRFYDGDDLDGVAAVVLVPVVVDVLVDDDDDRGVAIPGLMHGVCRRTPRWRSILGPKRSALRVKFGASSSK